MASSLDSASFCFTLTVNIAPSDETLAGLKDTESKDNLSSSCQQQFEQSDNTLVCQASSVRLTRRQALYETSPDIKHLNSPVAKYAAIFLPSTLVQASLNEWHRSNAAGEKRPANNKKSSVSDGDNVDNDEYGKSSLPFYAIASSSTSSRSSATIDADQKRYYKLSQSLLSMTHPFLGHNFTVKSVIRVRQRPRPHEKKLSDCAQHVPADIILVDLSHAPWAAVVDLLDTTNSQLIHATNNAILQIILLSDVSFLTTKSKAENSSSLLNSTNTASASGFDLPTCPVCLYRIDPIRLGLGKIPNHSLCSKFCPSPHLLSSLSKVTPTSSTGQTSASPSATLDDEVCTRQLLLRPWPKPSWCICCHIIDDFWKQQEDHMASTSIVEGVGVVMTEHKEEELMFCYECTMHQTLWVCMTCGFVGCGRYSNKHAAQHFQQTGHPYSLELATLRIWDYVEGEFAHRLDLLECPSSPPVFYQWKRDRMSVTSYSSASSAVAAAGGVASTATARNLSETTRTSLGSSTTADAATATSLDAAHGGSIDYASIPADLSIDEKTPKKAVMIGEEYEALLQSALEEQAQHFEGEITRLQATLTAQEIDKSKITKDELNEIERIRADIGELQSKIDVVSRDLLDAQAEEASHRAKSQRLLKEQQVTQELLKKVRAESMLEQEEGRRQMDELEQQIADLKANQRMRDEFSQNEELSNAQIFGTTTAVEPSNSRGRSSKKGSKKTRRGFWK